MNIRRFFRLGCLTVAGFFWASCGGDSNSQGPDNTPDPESSSDVTGTSSSAEPESSSVVPESSSSDVALSSSSDVGELSSSSEEKLRLARDTSVTCTTYLSVVESCPVSSEPYYSCMDLQEFLKKDTTVSEKILNKWEKKLLSCGAIQEEVPLYGIVYQVCPHYSVPYLKCSDGKDYKLYAQDNGIAYVTEKEYYETHSSSSVAESSSSSAEPEDLVTNCPQDSFALFVDVLADVQKELYERIVKVLDENDTLPEAKKVFLDSIVDREKNTLRGNLFPYYWANYDYDTEHVSVSMSDHWFNGYVAKTRTCADETPEKTALYREKYDGILQECLDLINKELERIDADAE